jgi:hypothetical protein
MNLLRFRCLAKPNLRSIFHNLGKFADIITVV